MLTNSFTKALSAGLAGSELKVHSEWRLIFLVGVFGAACTLFTIFPHISLGAGIAALIAGLISAFQRTISSLTTAGLLIISLASVVFAWHHEDQKSVDIKKEHFTRVYGVVEQLDFRPEKATRLLLRTLNSKQETGLGVDKVPLLIRFTVRTKIEPDVSVGSLVGFDAIVGPLGGAVVPGGYNFGRHARFQGIDAEGFSASNIVVVDKDRSPVDFNSRLWLRALRMDIADKILNEVDGQAGALAVALTLGFRHHITDGTSEELRRAGLSHLLAISGLHMGLVAAFAFFVFELLFAAIPATALRFMPRKLAVFPAWAVAVFYLLLSGGSTATVRAFIMVSVAMLAVLADRRVVSLRSVAIAAFIILVLSPQAALTIGFQMSFAATAGLVAFFEFWQKRKRPKRGQQRPGVFLRILTYIGLIGVTSLVAQVSISPIALYHFQAVSVVGLIANILVLPLISLMIMPLLLVSLLLVAFDAVWLVAGPLQYGLEAVLFVANQIGGLSFSTIRILPMGDLTFAFLISAFIGLLVFRSRQTVVLAGLVASVGILLPQKAVPETLISRSGKIVALHDGQTVSVSGGRQKSFRYRAWRQYWGFDPYIGSEKLKRMSGPGARRYQLFDQVYLTEVTGLSALRPTCAAGDIVIIFRRYERYCKNASLVLTKEDLAEKGPAGITQSSKGQPQVVWSNP